ncbi:hypothetical protein C8J57DRAFT_758520 [Mycena rebaudengoi]|nr:hypothetical protein C8J57DRAFT_758520 [Mycena rebaudengoi]
MRGLPTNDAPKRSRIRLYAFAILLLLSIGGAGIFSQQGHIQVRSASRDFKRLPVSCPPQLEPLVPALAFNRSAVSTYRARLQGAIRVRTETFDDKPADGSDPWYDKFYDFETYLKKTYPNVFASLELDHLATHGLLLTWKGSDESLSPIILMAHQDVVPIPEETVDRWTHPPFGGHIDDEGWIWGRGGGDCKNLLISELTAVDELLNAGFKPVRTVLLSFGFDEEFGSVRSAQAISTHIEAVYGPDSILMIVDEGGGIMDDYFGRTWIAPATAEKGNTNIQVTVGVPGGHSSIPPAHTAIGILSALITTLEGAPFPYTLSPANPFAIFAQCLAEHGNIDAELRRALAHERTWNEAARLMAERDPLDAARLSTTQAVDIVHGGVKVNALPEHAYAVINHRVSRDFPFERLQQRYRSLLAPEAARFNLTLVDFAEDIPEGTARYLRLGSTSSGDASPVSPAAGDAWELFARTSQHLWPGAIVAPYLGTAATDTRYCERLTRAIFRFQAVRSTERLGIHTVDERVHTTAHLNTIEWLHALIQNADAFRG